MQGGVVRDVLLREIPLVLSDGELYASAAPAGVLVVVGADLFDVYGPAAAGFGVGVVFALRVLAIKRRWSAPAPRGVDDR